MGLQWIDPTPENSCETCLHYDGRVFPEGGELPLPAHLFCECFYTDVDGRGEAIDWDDEPEHARRTYILHAAWLLRSGEELPPALEPLRDEAEEHNRQRENGMKEKILTFAQPGRVDRQNHVIHGVSLIQAVEARGHGMMVDAVTLDQVVSLGNGRRGGIKSRYTHPGLSSDGLGRFLGRVRGLRLVDDKAVGDLYLAEIASRSPDGDLRGYVEGLAEEDPEAFGMSIVFDMAEPGWIVGGEEINQWVRPEDAENDLPLTRLSALHASDVVDEPAANRDGLFAASFGNTTSGLAQCAFSLIDAEIDNGRLSLDDIEAWLQGSGELSLLPAGLVTFAQNYDFNRKTAVQFGWRYLQARRQRRSVFEKVGKDMAALGASEELEKRLADLEAELAQSRESQEMAAAQVVELEATARAQRFEDLIGSGDSAWAGERATHLQMLQMLGNAGGEDSAEFAAYVTQQKALTAQLVDSALFTEIGRGGEEAGSGGSVAAQIEVKARKLAESAGITYEQAYTQVISGNPELYADYQKEA